MKNVFKFIAVALAAGTFCLSPVTAVYAENSISTGTVESVDESSAKGGSSGETVTGTSGMASSASVLTDLGGTEMTTEELGGRILDTTSDVVDQFRVIMCVVCVGAFVVGASIAVFGAISKKGTIIPGVIAMVVSAVAFGLIYNAPSIVAWGATLLS